MQKPYIICHMMMAADGRIDCSMTEKINGYQKVLDCLDYLVFQIKKHRKQEEL